MLPFRLANVVEIYRKLMDYVQFYGSSDISSDKVNIK